MTRSQYVKVIIAATVGDQPKGQSHILENYMKKAFELGIITKNEFPKHLGYSNLTRRYGCSNC